MKLMKKLFIPTVAALATAILLTGCVAAIGNREGRPSGSVTLGQQLIDLQKAKDAGAISDAEYQTERTKLLNHK